MPHFLRVPGTFNSSIDERISGMLGSDSHLYLVSYRTCTMDGTPQFVGVGHRVRRPGTSRRGLRRSPRRWHPSEPARSRRRSRRLAAERPNTRTRVRWRRRPRAASPFVASAGRSRSSSSRIRARCPTLPNCRGRPTRPSRPSPRIAKQHSHARKHARRDVETRRRGRPRRGRRRRHATPTRVVVRHHGRTQPTHRRPRARRLVRRARERRLHAPGTPRWRSSGVSAPSRALSRPARPGRRPPPRTTSSGEGRMRG